MSMAEVPGDVDMKLEVLVPPVSDVDRAESFYRKLGWRVDADVNANGVRLLQFTPPGSGCSIQFGKDLTPAAPGSARNVYLVVDDMEAARADLAGRGVAVSDAFHESSLGGRFQELGGTERVEGIAGIEQLRVVRHLQRSGRELLAPAGGDDPTARTDRRRHDFVCVRAGPGRCHDAVPRRRTASTRSESARPIRTGPPGTRPTWSQSRAGTLFRRDHEHASGGTRRRRAGRACVLGGGGDVHRCSQRSR